MGWGQGRSDHRMQRACTSQKTILWLSLFTFTWVPGLNTPLGRVAFTWVPGIKHMSLGRVAFTHEAILPARLSSYPQDYATLYRRKQIFLRLGDVSAVKSTSCSFRGSGFTSQYPHGGSQAYVSPVPGDPMLMPLLWPLQVLGTYGVHRHICR